ncbi:MAG: patatin-like phospholipase family protein [Cytophagales bacterium]|nr:patatin-like phospholipase family protein [Cytophagales bacterium]
MSRSVALVLSSGGARGYAHIGVIEALERHGFSIKSVTGCSMGAVVGGIYAAGGLDKFKAWACKLERTDVFKLYDFVFSSQGLIRGERVFKQIESYIPDRNIDELKIPFKALATDLNAQKEIIFSTGSLYRALRASSTIPAVVKPTEFEGLELLDGGILNPLPINHVTKDDNDLIVAVDVNARIPYDHSRRTKTEIAEDRKFSIHLEKLAKKWFRKETKRINSSKKKLGFFDLMMKSIDMMQDRITENIIDRYPPDILVQISRSACSTFDYYKAEKLIEEGKTAFEKAWIKFTGNSYVER